MQASSIATVAGVVVVLIWLYLITARGGFWRAGQMTLPLSPPAAEIGLVAAIVPARNEAEYIGCSVASLLAQTGVSLRVFVVDDGSTDGTAQRARAAAGGRSESLTVIAGQTLPPGWTGKLWAVQQGVEKALELGPRFLLLTDADIQHSPENIVRLAQAAERGGYDLASLMVQLHCESVAEKLLIPAFVYFFFKLYPPAWVADPRRRNAGAAGGCLLIRPEALAQAGGIATVRNAIIDDCALARSVKRGGGKVWLGLADQAVSLRAYGSFAAIDRMISRSAFCQLRHSALLLLATMAGMAVTYLLPPMLLLSGHRPLMALGGVAWALMTASYLPMVRFYRLNPVWAFTLPLASLFYSGATMHSAVCYWSGRGGQWKGRVQDFRKQEIGAGPTRK